LDTFNISGKVLDSFEKSLEYLKTVENFKLPAKPLAKLVLFAHYLNKTKDSAINPTIADLITNKEDRQTFKEILIQLGYLVKVKNYSVKHHGDIFHCSLNPKDFYTIKDQGLLKEIHSVLNLAKNRSDKNANRYNYAKGVFVDAQDLLESDRKVIRWAVDKDKALEDITTQEIQINKVNSGDFGFMKKTRREKRLYSNFTNLKKEYRARLKVAAGRLIEVDIRSSHPSILTLALNRFLDASQGQEIGIEDFIPELKGKEWDRVRLNREFKEFEDLLTNDIYDSIGLNINLDRENTKLALLSFLNDYHNPSQIIKDEDGRPIKATKHPKIKEWMILNFPYMFELINWLHIVERSNTSYIKGEWVRSERAIRHSVSLMVMDLEASIILDGIALKFRKDFPDSIIITVHDSFIIEESNLSYINDLINKTYSSYGIFIATKISILGNNNLNNNMNNGEACGSPSHICFPKCPEKGVKSAVKGTKPPKPPIPRDEVKGTKIEVKGTKRKRVSNIKTLQDGRFTIKFNGKKVNSRKYEDLFGFEMRLKEVFGYENFSYRLTINEYKNPLVEP